MAELRWAAHGGVLRVELLSPVLSRTTLGELVELLLTQSALTRPLPIVLVSTHPTIFLAGADLKEIAVLDQHSSVGYARLGRRVLELITRHPRPVVAAVDGSCTGGGFDLVTACDAVVASRTARFSHPGVLRGLVTGWGGTSRIPNLVVDATARGALIAAGALAGEALEGMGVTVVPATRLEARAGREALRLSRLHPCRLELWRSLKRASFIDIFRAFVVHQLVSETGSAWRQTRG